MGISGPTVPGCNIVISKRYKTLWVVHLPVVRPNAQLRYSAASVYAVFDRFYTAVSVERRYKAPGVHRSNNRVEFIIGDGKLIKF